tara:strand:+ start:58 stop:234 length:177 start_codon:yes stop_codon:yes gene_type:complete
MKAIIGILLILFGLYLTVPHFIAGDTDGALRTLFSIKSLIFTIGGLILLVIGIIDLNK